jgi:16S rRNA (guanine966-N2)-methyltransferase
VPRCGIADRAMRVTGGTLGGRLLRVPASGVRPTADRVRESLFACLGPLDGARVLDLYSGTGALGIEALSRGAITAVFVDRDARALAFLRRNLDELGLLERARIVHSDGVRALRRLERERERFDLILADPPYASGEAERVLAEVARGAILVPGGTLVVECGRRHPLPTPEGLAVVDERHYGDTRVVRFEAPEAAESSSSRTRLEETGAGRA